MKVDKILENKKLILEKEIEVALDITKLEIELLNLEMELLKLKIKQSELNA